MLNYKYLWILLFVAFSHNSFSQDDELIKVKKLVPLYCQLEILEKPHAGGTVIIQGEKGVDKSCIDRVRLTFQNSEIQKIRNVTFDLILYERIKSDSSNLYKGRHTVIMNLLPEETVSVDVPLFSKTSSPSGKNSFDDTDSWGWKVEIIKINSKIN